ncbi:hypothetical protein [Mycoplasma sp. ATU-Cv-508]|uniref:hypothetical protein n=1 Tax=Mycoplasma sp. ATU-Cv-508 TaxID=2048001 RepID=UPI000FDE89B6
MIKLHDLHSDFFQLRDQFLARGDKFTNATDFRIMNLLSKDGDKFDYVNGANAENLGNYFFLDELHPTGWAHEQIAEKLYKIAKNFKS